MRNAPLPQQFRQKIPHGGAFFKVKEVISDLSIHTVCEEAKCPNRTDCYSRGTLTLQILGNVCTRRCGFCAETTGRPEAVDASEPVRVLETVRRLKISHVVITAPARDDVADGGASIFARTVSLLKENAADVTVEVLVSDLEGKEESLRTLLESRPDIFNHNIETVRRLTPHVRAKAAYDTSIAVLKRASEIGPGVIIKSGLMVGLGETLQELFQTFLDLRGANVHCLTIGQYLRPSEKHLPVQKIYTPEEFQSIKKRAEEFGFKKVFCAPLVRSSYHAEEIFNG